MRPVTSRTDLEDDKVVKRRHVLPVTPGSESIRLCTGRNCTAQQESYVRELGRWTFLNLLFKEF